MAATYFHRMASFFAETGWHLIESSVLATYAKCLKHLNRKEEYVRTLLRLLSKAANVKRQRAAWIKATPGHSDETSFIGDDEIDTDGYVFDLLKYSKRLAFEERVDLSLYFADIAVDQYPQFYEDKDGFKLMLRLRHLFSDEIELQTVKLGLIGNSDIYNREIWLESNGPITLKQGLVKVLLESNVSEFSDAMKRFLTCLKEVIPGSYGIDKIILSTHNLSFLYDAASKNDARLSTASSILVANLNALVKTPRIEYYLPPRTLEAKLSASKSMHLDKARSIEIEVLSGRNDILRGELHVRPGTAGLRLHTADSELLHGSVDLTNNIRPGVIGFASIEKWKSIRVKIPYGLDNETNDIIVSSLRCNAPSFFFFFCTYSFLLGQVRGTLQNCEWRFPICIKPQSHHYVVARS
jgi:hypothetical protein